MKQCEQFEHTADVGLEARADTLGELFEALAEGAGDVICPREQVLPAEVREVSRTAEDVEALVVDFLCDVLGIIQGDRFMIALVMVNDVSENHVKAEVLGEPYDPRLHEIATEIKAVTYHQLFVGREGDRWTGRVILDL